MSTLVVTVEACGPPQSGDAGPSDAQNDLWADASVGDAILEASTGCPYTPVVCPDADYFITISGDGPPQTLRSNVRPSNNFAYWWVDAAYYVPTAQVWPGQGTPAHLVSGSSTPDAQSTQIIISSDSNTCYYRNGGAGPVMCSAISDAMAQVTYTQTDSPGGIVAGSYSVVVASVGDAALALSGSFVACRICDAPPTP